MKSSPSSTSPFFHFDHGLWQICGRQPLSFYKQMSHAAWSLVARALPRGCILHWKLQGGGKTAVFFCFSVTGAYGITWWQFTTVLLRNSLFWQQTKVSLCLLFRIQEVGFKLGQTQNHMFWHHFNTWSVKEGHFKKMSPKPSIQYEPYSSRLWKNIYTFCLQLLGGTTTCEKGI